MAPPLTFTSQNQSPGFSQRQGTVQQMLLSLNEINIRQLQPRQL